MGCRFVACPYSYYAGLWSPHPDFPGFSPLPLAIWIQVYTCLSGCQFAYISYYSVSFMEPLINYEMGAANIFVPHLEDQNCLPSPGGGGGSNLVHTSHWGQQFLNPFRVLENILAHFRGGFHNISCILLSYLPGPPYPIIRECPLTYRNISIEYVLLKHGLRKNRKWKKQNCLYMREICHVVAIF